MTPRSLDSINIRRKLNSTPSNVEAPSANRRSSAGTSGVIIAALLLAGAFFLAARPSADGVATSAATSQVAAPAQSANPPGLGLPQPDQGQSLEHAVILDHPLATSQTQDGKAGTLTPSVSTTTSTIKTNSFSLRILNGSGQSGLATQEQTALSAKGFRITDVGTAVNNYSSSIIYYTANHEAQAKLVAAEFRAGTTKLQQDTIAEPADVLLVIGADGTSF